MALPMRRKGRGTFVCQTVEENLEIGAMSRRDRTGISADIKRACGYFPPLKAPWLRRLDLVCSFLSVRWSVSGKGAHLFAWSTR